MARHKDISKAHARLEGEGWHIEYHREAVVTSSSKNLKRNMSPLKEINGVVFTITRQIKVAIN